MDPQHCPHLLGRGRHRSPLWAICRTARTLGILSVALLASGCLAFVYSRHVSRICNPEAARSAGERDALSGDEPRENYGEACGVAEAAVNQAYRAAYDGVEEDRRGTESGFLPRLGR